MGSSKKKSSFRIDDLLQQPQYEYDNHNAPIKRHMFSSAPPPTHTTTTTNQHQHHTHTHTHPTGMEHVALTKHRHADGSSATFAPSAPHSGHRMAKGTLPSEMPSSELHHMTTSKAPSLPPSGYADHPPHKPMPMYAPPPALPPATTGISASALLDITKPNYCFPMPMAIAPNFSHAATAYLEHYANTFHKGE